MRPSRRQLLALFGPGLIVGLAWLLWALGDRVYLRVKDRART